VVTRTGETDVAEVSLAPARAGKILAAVNGAGVSPTVLDDDGVPADAPAVTLIVPQIVCHRVLALRNDSDFNEVAKARDGRDVMALFAAGSQSKDLGSLRFDPGTANVHAGSELAQKLKDAYPNLDGQLRELLVFTRPGAATTEPLAEQAQKLADAADAAPPAGGVIPLIQEAADDTGWPQCPFVTVIVIIG
jgi:hypothetical protein